MKIGVGGFQHETNTFQSRPTGFADFLRVGGWPGLTRGEPLFDDVAGRNLPISGFITEAGRRGHLLIPLVWANAQPSGIVEAAAFERVSAMMIADLAAQLPFDAVYLDLHGAMVTTAHDDGEGEFLRRVRAVVGPDAVIAVSLDWHANVTPSMLEHADWMTGYRTYPHVDMAETGARAAELIERGRPGGKTLRPLPFLIPLTAQCSLAEPNRALFQRLREIEAATGAALTFAPGFPPADVWFAGPSVLAYAGDDATAASAADQMVAAISAAEVAFAADRPVDVDDAVRLALAHRVAAPLILVDTQDNPGAGAGSDTTSLLKALVEAGVARAALALFNDPLAAEAAHRAGIGARLRLTLGGRSGVPGDLPFETEVTVGALASGPFIGSGPMWQGAELNLGLMARLDIGGVSVVVGSVPQQPSTQAIFRRVGIEPAEQAVLVVKSSVHFRADFQDIADRVVIVRAPGINLADPAEFPYRKLRAGVRLSPLGPALGG